MVVEVSLSASAAVFSLFVFVSLRRSMLALEVAVEEEEVGGADWSAATAEWSDVIVGGVLELSLLLLSFAVGVAAFSLAAAARSLLADDDVDMLLLLCVMRVSSCRTITQQ